MRDKQKLERPPISWRRHHLGLIAAAKRNVALWERAPALFADELASARLELEIYQDTLPAE